MPRNNGHRDSKHRKHRKTDDFQEKPTCKNDGDLLNSAFLMINDIGNLDPIGMEGFTRAFKETIHPPTVIVDEFKNGVMNLAGSATMYIFFTIFAIAAVILLCLAFVNVLSWVTSIVIIVVVGLLVLLIASLLYNRVNDYLNLANKEIDSHIADYTQNIFGDITSALKAGLNAYACYRTPKEEELIDPVDSVLYD